MLQSMLRSGTWALQSRAGSCRRTRGHCAQLCEVSGDRNSFFNIGYTRTRSLLRVSRRAVACGIRLGSPLSVQSAWKHFRDGAVVPFERLCTFLGFLLIEFSRGGSSLPTLVVARVVCCKSCNTFSVDAHSGALHSRKSSTRPGRKASLPYCGAILSYRNPNTYTKCTRNLSYLRYFSPPEHLAHCGLSAYYATPTLDSLPITNRATCPPKMKPNGSHDTSALTLSTR